MLGIVDIIIPVTNVNPDLAKCVSNVLQYSDSVKISIVYNCKLDSYMAEQQKKMNSCPVDYISYQYVNGFFDLANIVISKSLFDVVILDPHIIVTPDWLEKMRNCANSNPNISCVTPYCNNGSICSLPIFNMHNKMPFHMETIHKFSKFVEEKSNREYPEIPVSIGYCMLIKREILCKIKFLDNGKTCRDIGSDRIFSWRSHDLGYKNVLCDDTFVYCPDNAAIETYKLNSCLTKNNISFYKSHIEVLWQYIHSNPLKESQDFIRIKWLTNNGKRNILFNLHYGYEKDNKNNVGGTQFLVRDLVKSISFEYNLFVLFNDFQGMTLNLYTNSEIICNKYTMDANDSQIGRSNALCAQRIKMILTDYDISIVHVHHVVDQTLDIILEADKLGLPIILSIHDFYWICPSLNMMSHEYKYCLDLQNDAYCAECLRQKFGYKPNALQEWRQVTDKVFEMCKVVIFPTSVTKDIYMRYFPRYSEKCAVISHGSHPMKVHYKRKIVIDDQINIAFVGYVSQLKGSDLAYKLIRSKRGLRINWFFFGLVQDKRFHHIHEKNVHVCGTYSRDDLPKLIYENNIHLASILTIVPETFCFVLSEIMDIGIPVIATDIGALGERVAADNSGWLIPANSNEDDYFKIIDLIQVQPALYVEKVENLSVYEVKNVFDMASEYREIYKNVL